MTIRSLALLSAAATILTAIPAFADSVTYNVTTLSPTIAPGATLTFTGSITALASNMDNVSLLGDTFTLSGPGTLDDTPFFSSPASLAPGQNFTGDLFSLTLPGNAAPGDYTGSFDIIVAENGGQDTFNGPFSYTVAGNTSVTPEPGSWLLLSTGLAGAGLLRRRIQARF